MRFELDDDQRALLDGLSRVLTERAGPDRARALGGDAPAYDHDLDRLLRENGFVGFEFGDGPGPLEAALVVEAVAASLGVVAAGTGGLVVPAVASPAITGPVAIAELRADGRPVPVRFTADAGCLIAVGPNEAVVVELGPGSTERVPARFGYPLAAVHHWEGTSLGPGSASRVRAWWRVAIAAEMVGTMRAALDLTVRYVSERRQFGHPIGSFQAVQHRLAECEVLVQGSRWLMLEAAWSGAPEEAAAAALTYASRAAALVFSETHQFSGAMGFSTEYDLHLWSMRLPALRAEASNGLSPAQDLTAARWIATAS